MCSRGGPSWCAVGADIHRPAFPGAKPGGRAGGGQPRGCCCRLKSPLILVRFELGVASAAERHPLCDGAADVEEAGRSVLPFLTGRLSHIPHSPAPRREVKEKPDIPRRSPAGKKGRCPGNEGPRHRPLARQRATAGAVPLPGACRGLTADRCSRDTDRATATSPRPAAEPISSICHAPMPAFFAFGRTRPGQPPPSRPSPSSPACHARLVRRLVRRSRRRRRKPWRSRKRRNRLPDPPSAAQARGHRPQAQEHQHRGGGLGDVAVRPAGGSFQHDALHE